MKVFLSTHVSVAIDWLAIGNPIPVQVELIHGPVRDGYLLVWSSAGMESASINTLRPGQNGRHFADNVFKCIFLSENVRIALKISLEFVPKVPITNIPALV